MASTVTIACPECDKKINAPSEVLGKKVRCKACGHTFMARAAAAKPPAKPRPDDEEDEGSNPYGVTGMSFAPRCPFCANEMESEEAVICLHCGYNVRTRQLGKTRRVHETTGGDTFLWLLPGILCAIVVVALIVFDVVYWFNSADWFSYTQDWDKDPWYSLFAHLGVRIWLVVMSLFFAWHAGRFAVKRLIQNPKPPEVERYH
jgi:hypothetical protein